MKKYSLVPPTLAAAFLVALLWSMPSAAGFFADGSALTVTSDINAQTICDGWETEWIANHGGTGDGVCDYPNDGSPGAAHFERSGPNDETWMDLGTYLPAGTTAANYFDGQQPRRRFANFGASDVGYGPNHWRWSSWEHHVPDAAPTCPLNANEDICLQDGEPCDDDWAFGYGSPVYPRQNVERIFEFSPTSTPHANDNNATDTKNDGSLAFSFPPARYAVVQFVMTWHNNPAGATEGAKMLLAGTQPAFYGVNRSLTLLGFSCDGIPTGGDAVIVDRADIYTGPSGQVFSTNCDLEANGTAAGVNHDLCTVGLDGGTSDISGVFITSIDGAYVGVDGVRAGNVYTGPTTPVGAPPLGKDIPPLELSEFDNALDNTVAGCLQDPARLAEIEAYNPAWADVCLHDTMHYLEGDTHHGDGDGWRHPGGDNETTLAVGVYSDRASGAYGHLYPLAHLERDTDGVPDSLDNCSHLDNAGSLSCDSDADGYGNACDTDYNQNGFTDAGDQATMNAALQTFAPGVTDHNCDGFTTAADYEVFEAAVPGFDPPGPSGLSCAGTAPCP